MLRWRLQSLTMEYTCQKCAMNFAAAAPPEKCPACGAGDVVKRGSPMSLAGKLRARATCDGCDKKGPCDPKEKFKCCD